MATSPQPEMSVAQSDSDLIAGLKLRFGQNWDAGLIDLFAAELASWSLESRRLALAELVEIDLDRRWESGQHTEIEQYLTRFPDLGTAETVSAALIFMEWDARQQFGEPPRFGEFARRFPRQAPVLQQLIRHMEAHDSASRQAAKRDTSKIIGANDESQLGERGGVSPPVGSASPPSHQGADAAPLANSMAATPLADLPEIFGRYRILRVLGDGGMGTVYLALDTQLDREVALKVPHVDAANDSDYLERFDREAKTAAKLSHANICQVYDVGEIDGRRYLTMEFIDGKPLSKKVGSKSLKDLPVIQLVRQVALAVGAAHKLGIIHRDLKPANIMLTSDGRPKVTDFGLARRISVSHQRLTQKGMIIGTPAYMSLEQLNGTLDDIGPHSDVYSLGVILYELLTAHLPFDVLPDAPVTALFAKILTTPPDPPTKYRPDLDPALEAIVLKAIAKEHADRYPTMTEFAAALAEYSASRKQEELRRSGDISAPGDPNALAARNTDLPPTRVPTPPAPQDEKQITTSGFPVFIYEPTFSTKPTFAPQPKRGKKLPWFTTIVIGVGALLLLAVALLFHNGDALVKIEVHSKDIEVTLDDETIKLKDGSINYKIKPGDHTLLIKSGNTEFKTDKFTLKKGDNPAVSVELVESEIVAKWGDSPMGLIETRKRKTTQGFAGQEKSNAGATNLPTPSQSPGSPTQQSLQLAPLKNVTIREGERWTLKANAIPVGLNLQELRFALGAEPPTGCEIDEATGLISWTPTEAQGPGRYPLSVVVSSRDVPLLKAEQVFDISVLEVNQPPIIDPIVDQSVVEDANFQLGVKARDPDQPPSALRYALQTNPPIEARINPTTGIIDWKAQAADLGNEYLFHVDVSESENPPKNASYREFKVRIRRLTRYDVLLVENKPRIQWRAKTDWTGPELGQEIQLERKNLTWRPICISGFRGDDGSHRYASIWLRDSISWAAYYEQDPAARQSIYDNLPANMSVIWNSFSQDRSQVILREDKAPLQFEVRDTFSRANLVAHLEKVKTDGYQPVAVCQRGLDVFGFHVVRKSFGAIYDLGLSETELQQKLSKLPAGYHPISIDGFGPKLGRMYSFVAIQDGTNPKWKVHPGLKPNEFEQALIDAERQGLRPLVIDVE